MEDERNYEAEAMEQGWVGKADWKGDPDKHVDAKVFVERGEKISGILKSRLDKQEILIKGLQATNKKFGEYHKQTLEKTQQDNATRVAELEAELAQAITDGDGQAYTKVNREISNIRSEPVPIDDSAAWGQLAQAWANENQWYADNPKLRRYADGISDEIRAAGYDGQAYFSELTRQVKSDFPEEFKNPNKSRPTGAETEGEPAPSSKARTYDNLPADAKKACDGFVADGFMTQKDYVKQFEFED